MWQTDAFRKLATTSVITGVVLIIAACVLGYYTHLLYFHPLAKYQGPRLAALSDLWLPWSISQGDHPYRMMELHRKHGDVVRTGPNSLSFATADAYHDIYGSSKFLKCAAYERPGDFATVRDPAAHARHRKRLAPAFSPRALRDQEDVVHRYINLLLSQIDELGSNGEKGVNITEAYNWLTFDVIGDLAFGDSFNSVAEASSKWISLITDAVRYTNVLYLKKSKPFLSFLLAPLLYSKDLKEKYEVHTKLSREKAKKRIEIGDLDRQDFFVHLIKDKRITERELISDADLLVIAGSETVATSLAATTYFLLNNPECLAELTKEVRGSFKSLNDIMNDSTSGLKYLAAVIEEGLRLFPPLSLALPRDCPGAMIGAHFIPKGVVVASDLWCMSRDPRYWFQPEAFRPERWIKDSGWKGEDNKAASQPFSVGTRACIGINLAYLELRVVLAKVVFTYDLELVSRIEDWQKANKSYALWTLPEILVKFHPRK